MPNGTKTPKVVVVAAAPTGTIPTGISRYFRVIDLTKGYFEYPLLTNSREFAGWVTSASSSRRSQARRRRSRSSSSPASSLPEDPMDT